MMKETSKAQLKWTPISESVIYTFQLKILEIVTVCYAPTEVAEEEFYNSLEATVETVPKHKLLLILGSLKAKIGEGNNDRRRIMGRVNLFIGEKKKNESGERLCRFAKKTY